MVFLFVLSEKKKQRAFVLKLSIFADGPYACMRALLSRSRDVWNLRANSVGSFPSARPSSVESIISWNSRKISRITYGASAGSTAYESPVCEQRFQLGESTQQPNLYEAKDVERLDPSLLLSALDISHIGQ